MTNKPAGAAITDMMVALKEAMTGEPHVRCEHCHNVVKRVGDGSCYRCGRKLPPVATATGEAQ